jgi:hypothetical protein
MMKSRSVVQDAKRSGRNRNEWILKLECGHEITMFARKRPGGVVTCPRCVKSNERGCSDG